MKTFRRVAVGLGYAGLLVISMLMVWDAFFPHTFVAFLERPIRDYIEDFDLIAVPTAVALLGYAVYVLIRVRRPIGTRILRVLLMLAWCLLLAMCCILMMARSGIV
jgi:hypothetical protein